MERKATVGEAMTANDSWVAQLAGPITCRIRISSAWTSDMFSEYSASGHKDNAKSTLKGVGDRR